MPRRTVVHFTFTRPPYAGLKARTFPKYCMLDDAGQAPKPTRSTTVPAEVTCQHCLNKMRARDQGTPHGERT